MIQRAKHPGLCCLVEFFDLLFGLYFLIASIFLTVHLTRTYIIIMLYGILAVACSAFSIKIMIKGSKSSTEDGWYCYLEMLKMCFAYIFICVTMIMALQDWTGDRVDQILSSLILTFQFFDLCTSTMLCYELEYIYDRYFSKHVDLEAIEMNLSTCAAPLSGNLSGGNLSGEEQPNSIVKDESNSLSVISTLPPYEAEISGFPVTQAREYV